MVSVVMVFTYKTQPVDGDNATAGVVVPFAFVGWGAGVVALAAGVLIPAGAAVAHCRVVGRICRDRR